MQYSENFGLKEPEYGEKAKVDDLNFNTEKIDTIMGNNRSMIAEYFDQTQSYTAGKVVQLNGKTYRFKVDHAPGNFNPSEVDEEPIGNFIGEGGGSADVTKTASGNPIEITDGASAPLVKCVTQITGYQQGSGTPSPDNIRPIVAYTEGEIEVRGKNIVNKDGTNTANGYLYGKYLYNNGSEATPTTPEDWFISEYISLKPNTTYTISGLPSSNANAPSIVLYSEKINTSSVEGYSYINRTSFSFTTGATAHYARVSIGTSFANTIQLEEGSTPTTYEPYTSTTHTTTTYPSAIYRGSEDVVGGSVEKKWGVVVFDGSLDENWSMYGSGSPAAYAMQIDLSDMAQRTITTTDNIIVANYLQTIRTNATWGDYDGFISRESQGTKLVTGIKSITTVADWKTYLSTHNLVVAYELQTPTTSSVTPTNLPIKSLSGYTHIESTTGDMEVEYITEEFQPLVDLIESNKHVYSTAEQIVGTWIDGSTVYEKTYDIGYLTSNNKTIAHGISGFGHIIQIHGYVTNDTYNFNLPHVTTDAASCVGVHVDSTNIYITSYDRGDYYGYVIIQYTKTTPTRSLNLTRSAVTDEIPDEIKNAPFEEKPDVNEADDDAPTEVDER